ncbi:MAG: YopX family protein [Ruminococcus sp.]|nr:YopX family protein [Ruminococcus sp.]MDE7225568.1 YopX family protein [Ruminococcus sp.]
MREILFRGKRKDNGEWFEGFYSVDTVSSGGNYHVAPVISESPSKLFGGEWHEVIPETVGQFTGMTDKNGVKIFEGDIVSFADCWDTQHKGVVCWRSGSYDVDCSKSDNEEDKDFFRLFTAYACGAKIIGNIHNGGIKI